VEPLALPIRARFVPLHDTRTARLTGVCRTSPAGQFFTVLLATDGRLAFVRTRGQGRLPHRPAPSHRGCHGGGDRVRAARRRVEDWHGAVVGDTVRGSGRCASGVVMSQGFPVSSRRDWIW
jgi:hypothetical protein